MKPQLISFKLCPFVQRSVITLKEKGADFDITYINIMQPPEWFAEVSPLGKVPVMKVGDTVLFESAVIMEYLDEVNPPSLHPTEPLKKALNRAWMEYSSELLGCQREMMMAKDEEGYSAKRDALSAMLKRLEGLVEGPYFNGAEFNLVDAAYAPFFMRYQLIDEMCSLGLLDAFPKVKAWSELLLERPSVKESVVEEFPDIFCGHLENGGGHIATLIVDDE